MQPGKAGIHPRSRILPTPCVCAEERRASRIRASDCLSRRRVRARPRLDRAPQVAPQGTQTAGSPSLCLLSLGEARESESPAGASPGLFEEAKQGKLAKSFDRLSTERMSGFPRIRYKFNSC